MARIRVIERHGRYMVSIRGELGAADLRRLERVCAKALTVEVLPLELSIHEPPADDAARAFLKRLEARGAIVRVLEE